MVYKKSGCSLSVLLCGLMVLLKIIKRSNYLRVLIVINRDPTQPVGCRIMPLLQVVVHGLIMRMRVIWFIVQGLWTRKIFSKVAVDLFVLLSLSTTNDKMFATSNCTKCKWKKNWQLIYVQYMIAKQDIRVNGYDIAEAAGVIECGHYIFTKGNRIIHMFALKQVLFQIRKFFLLPKVIKSSLHLYTQI